jgi:dihydroorotase
LGVLAVALAGFCSAGVFRRAIIMPNLKPPVTDLSAAIAYRDRIVKALPSNAAFEPLMTLYLTDVTTRKDIQDASERQTFPLHDLKDVSYVETFIEARH